MNTLRPMIEEAERTIAAAIKHFKLTVKATQIVVTVQSHGRRAAIGWYAPKRWQNGKKEAIHEINMSAEYIKSHDMGELMLHELAHAENAALGIHDCTASQRHNKKFKSMAERLGLKMRYPKPDKRVGYGFTDLSDGGVAFLKKIAFKRQLFGMMRLTIDSSKKAGTRMLKVECPDCGYTVRTTAKWIEVGLPTCPCGCEMEAAG